ncbi:dihydrodipicolinate synthase family protein [Nonomuraea soli]|uniref:4-hydroxy-tetrahydrodipicolinate synthase n=1 Tax=Nonomuraea soli TaxID=1032476 RepID=A0A7W0CIZ5_9ACTN|nr:dihydrodipicolinate synthase family protein [Nonomuraea soli]MBA2891944.1 4-hydroxy-tetrahydrodipicolinate synthase [Nonomuraea soli]
MLAGIHVPLITPFAADGSVDLAGLDKLAHHVLDQGAAGLVALGTTGETATLTEPERAAVVRVAARAAREHGATLIVGAGSADPRVTADTLRSLRADAALVTVPSFVRPGERGVVAYFEALAAATAVPLVIYHIPYRTGQNVGAETLRHLGGLPMVAGVKYASGLDATAVSLLGDPPQDFSVLAGDDVFVSPLLALGAAGGILASAHLATRDFVELAGAWRAGDVLRARELGARLARVSVTLFAEPNPTVLKGVLHAQGMIATPEVRLPLLPAGRASVEAALASL